MNMKGKKLIVDYYMVHKVLDKIKVIIEMEKFDDIKTLIDIDNKLPVDIALEKCCDINYMCYER